MSKRALKKGKRRSQAVIPALGITGLSLSLAGGATASTGEASTSQPHELFLGEEEIFDTSLSTFFTFDKENGGQTSPAQQLKLARGGGCGCGHGGGCGGGPIEMRKGVKQDHGSSLSITVLTMRTVAPRPAPKTTSVKNASIITRLRAGSKARLPIAIR